MTKSLYNNALTSILLPFVLETDALTVFSTSVKKRKYMRIKFQLNFVKKLDSFTVKKLQISNRAVRTVRANH